MPRRNRAAKNCAWIDKYCTVPAGLDRGRRVRLTPAQRDVMRRIYDGNEIVEVTPPLSAYLVLLHLCGPEAVLRGEADFSFRNEKSFKADVFTTWSSAGPDLKEVLTLHGEHIVCPELGTRFLRRHNWAKCLLSGVKRHGLLHCKCSLLTSCGRER
jgi:hypothetical protein